MDENSSKEKSKKGASVIFRNPMREFYRKNSPDLSRIGNLNFRHFRFRLPDKTFKKINDRITDEAVLQKHLIRYAPLDAYYSVSKWLSPENLGSSKNEEFHRNVFLGMDLVFDIDDKNINKAGKEALKLLSSLKKRKIKINYIAFSGAKGFHVVCKDPWEYEEEDPRKREESAKRRRKELVEELKEEGMKFDEKVTVDSRRIIRIPGTINSKSGKACTIIGEEGIRKLPQMKSISRIKLAFFFALKGLSRMKEEGNYFATFLSSTVPGIRDRHVLLLEFQKRRWKRIQKEIRELQEKYKTGRLFVFEDDEKFYALSLKTFSSRRIEKILRAFHSANYYFFRKYRQCTMRIGNRISESGKVICGSPRFAGTIEDEKTDGKEKYFASEAHHSFLKSQNIDAGVYEKKHGRKEIMLLHCLLES